MEKLISDIFSMSFDIVIPLSSCFVALFVASVLFSIRYFSYRQKQRKYEKAAKAKELEEILRTARGLLGNGSFGSWDGNLNSLNNISDSSNIILDSSIINILDNNPHK